MKIRARKSNYNTQPDFEDFKLKEFSKDKEKFIPDLQLSCCDCIELEDLTMPKDSPKSFLVKFKADNLSDPQPIKPGLKGFILPEDGYKYSFDAAKSNFASSRTNHFNLELDVGKLETLAELLFTKKEQLVDITQVEVADYLIESCEQGEWESLLERADKSKWKKFLKSKLNDKYKSVYGKFDKHDISEAVRLDRTGLISLVSLMKKHNCLEAKDSILIDESLA